VHPVIVSSAHFRLCAGTLLSPALCVRISLSKGVMMAEQHKARTVATAAAAVRRVTVHIPVEVTYDLGKFQKVIESLGGRLGCGPCISGAACNFELITDYLVDPATLAVKPILIDKEIDVG
jgi:hypothetical protein